MNAEDASRVVVDSAMRVHTVLGPGLLESVYTACLTQELRKRGLAVRCEVPVPVVYEEIKLDAGYRLDMLVEESLIVELKAVECLAPIHQAQMLTYLKLSQKRLGLLINFNVVHLRDGIKRVINGY